jgi:putative MFS transporter
MLRAVDDAQLNFRFWAMSISIMVGAVLEFFDFFLISFVVPVLVDEWDLTFGQAGTVLLAAGLGAIIGSIWFGRLGDRYGRRRPLIAGILTYSLATGAMALAPEGGWEFLAVMRFIVGVGVAGTVAVAVPLLLELTPTRYRTKFAGFLTTAMVPVGILLAALTAGLVIPLTGWRVVFALGVLPAGLAIWVKYYVPESPRWLLDQGRAEEARGVIAWMLMRPREELAIEEPEPQPDSGTGYRHLLRYRKSFWVTTLAWFGGSSAVAGIVLWGPTFLKDLLDVSSDQAALLFVLVTLGSFAGRLTFSFWPLRIGRRRAGILMGLGAVPLVLAALASDSGVVFLLALVVAAFFLDGGFANLVPYTPEVFPTKLRAQGMGLAYGVSGIGRLVGPLVIAAIAGADNLVEPEATADAIPPGFLFLAACGALVAIGFFVFGTETHGKDLETLSRELVTEAGEPRAPRPPRPARARESGGVWGALSAAVYALAGATALLALAGLLWAL